MYIASLALTFLILPGIFIIIHATFYGDTLPLMLIVGKWMVFFAVGTRFLWIGGRQLLRPRASSAREFGVIHEDAARIMRTLALANLSFGLLGLVSLFNAEWIVPAALLGAFYYGFLAAHDFATKGKNLNGYLSTGSNAFVCLVLAAVVLTSL